MCEAALERADGGVVQSDPRFLGTLQAILRSPERGGLTSNVSTYKEDIIHNIHTLVCFQGLVYRYDVSKTDDGVGGEEGTFCLCTLWCDQLAPLQFQPNLTFTH